MPVVVDKQSLMYLQDAHVDYHDDLHRSRLQHQQPQRQEHLRLRVVVLDVSENLPTRQCVLLSDIIVTREDAAPAQYGSPGRLAQLVRAPRLHRGGHRFESCSAH